MLGLVALVCVVSGDAYVRYAEQLFESAREHLRLPFESLLVEGQEGWPAATLYRYHVLLQYDFQRYSHLFLCDADMRFEGEVGEEILGETVATLHPGFWKRSKEPYYCGAFVGGERDAFLGLARVVAEMIERDDERGVMAEWHDETHLNAALRLHPPAVTLSPSYCFPDDATGYPWLHGVERKLVAVDKTPEERAGR